MLSFYYILPKLEISVGYYKIVYAYSINTIEKKKEIRITLNLSYRNKLIFSSVLIDIKYLISGFKFLFILFFSRQGFSVHRTTVLALLELVL